MRKTLTGSGSIVISVLGCDVLMHDIMCSGRVGIVEI